MLTKIEQLIQKHRVAIDGVQSGTLDELPEDAYSDFYDFYVRNGEMPYGTAKARDGDPYQWVNERVREDVAGYTLF